jgi:hypothetical protein
MTRAARLAVVSLAAVLVIGAAASHLLLKPTASTPNAAATARSSRALVAVRQERVLYAGSVPIDAAELAAVNVVIRSGLHIVALRRLDAPISRPPLIVTTSAGLLAVVTAPIACADAPGVARAIHLVGTDDPAAPDHLDIGRIGGSIVMTGDPEVWAAIDPKPC